MTYSIHYLGDGRLHVQREQDHDYAMINEPRALKAWGHLEAYGTDWVPGYGTLVFRAAPWEAFLKLLSMPPNYRHTFEYPEWASKQYAQWRSDQGLPDLWPGLLGHLL